MNYKQAEQFKIFKCISGSHSYGTNVEGSDTDYKGMFIAPPYYMLGLDVVEQVENGPDDTLYEIRKYVKLATECNPNILELLFIDDKHILYRNKFYDVLRDNRHLFLSKRARHTFAGYAHAQLHKIKNHRGYVIDPPSHKPTREEFGLKNETVISHEHQNAIYTLPQEYVAGDLKDYILREKKYEEALKKWNSYQEWDKTRNPARKALEAKFGYDTKHASHLVRLFNMGEEILTKGTLTVYREEREELKAIRNGSWTYDKLIEFADNIDVKFSEYEKVSKLSYSPDRVKIKELLIKILSEAYGLDLGKEWTLPV